MTNCSISLITFNHSFHVFVVMYMSQPVTCYVLWFCQPFTDSSGVASTKLSPAVPRPNTNYPKRSLSSVQCGSLWTICPKYWGAQSGNSSKRSIKYPTYQIPTRKQICKRSCKLFLPSLAVSSFSFQSALHWIWSTCYHVLLSITIVVYITASEAFTEVWKSSPSTSCGSRIVLSSCLISTIPHIGVPSSTLWNVYQDLSWRLV